MRYSIVYIDRERARRRGWYVKDMSVTSCLVTRGGRHPLAIDARDAADEANREKKPK